MAGDAPPNDPDGFAAFLARLPAPDIAAALADAEPLDRTVPFRFAAGVRRRYGRRPHLPDGLVPIGDAVCSFNPVYGQGITVAALALRAGLHRCVYPDARRYCRAVDALLDGPWRLTVGNDLAFPHLTGARAPPLRVFNRYLSLVHASASTDPALATAFLRVTGMLDRPSALLRPGRIARVLWAARGPGAAGPGTPPRPEALTAAPRSPPGRPSWGSSAPAGRHR